MKDQSNDPVDWLVTQMPPHDENGVRWGWLLQQAFESDDSMEAAHTIVAYVTELRRERDELRAAIQEAVVNIRHVASCDGAYYEPGPNGEPMPVCPCETCGRFDEFADYLEHRAGIREGAGDA